MRKLWKPVKEALWKRKTKDNAKHDRTGNFHSTDSVLWEPAHISHDKVIGGIVDSGTRNKWEDPGEQEHRDPGVRRTAERIRATSVSAKVAIRFAMALSVWYCKQIR